MRDYKYLSKSKYKYVKSWLRKKRDEVVFMAQITVNGKSKSKEFEKERDAALCVDKWFLEMGKEPVNILKRK